MEALVNTRATHLLFMGLLAATIIAAWISYSSLPEQMAAHWNASGAVDGTLPRFWGVALFPLILALVYGIFVLIPRIDPLRRNIEAFQIAYIASDADAGIVEHKVQSSKLIDGLIDHFGDGLLVRYVELQTVSFASQATDIIRNLLGQFDLPVCQDNFAPACRDLFA